MRCRPTGRSPKTWPASTGTAVDRAAWRLGRPHAHRRDPGAGRRRGSASASTNGCIIFREIANLPVAPVEAGRESGRSPDRDPVWWSSARPDEAADKIQALWNQSGGFGAFLFMAHNWGPVGGHQTPPMSSFARYGRPALPAAQRQPGIVHGLGGGAQARVHQPGGWPRSGPGSPPTSRRKAWTTSVLRSPP